MIKSREVIPASLEHALVANRVLAALESQDLASDESREAVEEALRFLNVVLRGRGYASDRSVAVDSYKAALAYDEGVKAFELVGYQPGESDDPTVYLEELKKCASELKKNSAVDEAAVQALIAFFRTIRDIALANTERPLETVSW